ncbi:BlaI/MecI/CopY family transcriptional regulator [Cruoricaptor ignavus]|uniref:BlaI/MecI/CopY family transcriptional regulator n=1 Tax=Cruoricaptor ignavus TaxID=1118202 RepID=A0A7M1T2C0_9FLAO|nr:BlaI/MecI/CopY family transcriptional regulator [Cruoricaptor ignavus]QOR74016.1 BlaI/MecI/CopY family transcriptional regulator [Cruoricaptor ignavus]
MEKLTPAEEHLMLLFWELGEFYLKDAMAALPEPKLHQNTVSTYLKILTKKGFLHAEKEGRLMRYTTAKPREIYANELLDHLIKNYFGGDFDLIQMSYSQHQRPLAKTENSAVSNFLEELTSGKKSKTKKKKKSKK